MTLDESWFYLWMSHETVWIQAASNLQKWWNTWLGIAKWCLQLSGIHKVSILLARFQKTRNLM
jgi:hypothetical protein